MRPRPLYKLKITMTISKTNKITLGLIIGTIFFALTIPFLFQPAKPVSGATLTFNVPKVSTSSTVGVGPGSNIQALSTTTPGCINRVITTQNNPILLSFNGVTPSAQNGHWQTGSTTVSYDNGAFGCGPIIAYGYSSSTLTVTVLTDNY